MRRLPQHCTRVFTCDPTHLFISIIYKKRYINQLGIFTFLSSVEMWSNSPTKELLINQIFISGQPIYTRGGLTRRPLSELFEPNTSIPWASIVRDPWWWEYPELRPYLAPHSGVLNTPLPFYLRDSYLSPVKRHYLWGKHPIRPFCKSLRELTIGEVSSLNNTA